MNQLINDEAVYRTAPATPGLLNIVQCQKTFFLCLLYIYTFPIASFNFFCQLIELGSKLGLQRAQFWIWLTELGSYPNTKSLI